MKKATSLLMALLLVLSLAACGGSDEPPAAPEKEPEQTQQVAQPAAPEPEPVPEPEPEPKEIPAPITYTGSGDDVIEVEPFDDLYVIYVEGNAGGRHFSVTAYDADGNYLDLLVNTTEPYSGVVFDPTMSTALLEINAEGDWLIEFVSIYEMPVLLTGESMEGVGDAVFISDGSCKIAEISGNSSSNHFAVETYGDKSQLLVNTTEPYSGKVMIKTMPAVFVVMCESEWVIALS